MTKAELTGWEEMVLQKLIRHEKEGSARLPYPSEEYLEQLDELYFKISSIDHWEGYDGFK